MTFKIEDFKNNMKYDGARPNLFEVEISAGQLDFKDLKFFAKAAQLPGATIGTVPLFYFGREIKLAGNRTFADWTIQIINDEDFNVRKLIEKWMGRINSHADNVRTSNFVSPSNYMGTATVKQYGKASSNPIRAYQFNGIFPVDLAPIDLDWGSNDSVEEYSVTFAYQYWSSSTDGTGSITTSESPPQS